MNASENHDSTAFPPWEALWKALWSQGSPYRRFPESIISPDELRTLARLVSPALNRGSFSDGEGAWWVSHPLVWAPHLTDRELAETAQWVWQFQARVSERFLMNECPLDGAIDADFWAGALAADVREAIAWRLQSRGISYPCDRATVESWVSGNLLSSENGKDAAQKVGEYIERRLDDFARTANPPRLGRPKEARQMFSALLRCPPDAPCLTMRDATAWPRCLTDENLAAIALYLRKVDRGGTAAKKRLVQTTREIQWRVLEALSGRRDFPAFFEFDQGAAARAPLVLREAEGGVL